MTARQSPKRPMLRRETPVDEAAHQTRSRGYRDAVAKAVASKPTPKSNVASKCRGQSAGGD